jgi:hypothetical protein
MIVVERKQNPKPERLVHSEDDLTKFIKTLYQKH